MIRNRFLSLILIIAAYGALIIGVAFGLYTQIAQQENSSEENSLLYIAPGTGLLRIAHQFSNEQYARKHWHVLLVSKINGFEHQLKAGEYRFGEATTLYDKLVKVTQGNVHLRRLIIPEGLSALEIDTLVKTTEHLDLEGYTSPGEGTVLPETYFYERGETASALISRMQRKMQNVLDDAWNQRFYDLPFSNKEDALILASIVEKETAVASERPLVAAVFVNRLRKGMRLQSDPTVIYGITSGLPLGRGLKRSELRAETPYNTYRIRGLPAGPIANPGLESIKAVLNPADVDYLYFVADGSGGHAFASTLKEHNDNVARWRKIERKQLENERKDQ